MKLNFGIVILHKIFFRPKLAHFVVLAFLWVEDVADGTKRFKQGFECSGPDPLQMGFEF